MLQHRYSPVSMCRPLKHVFILTSPHSGSVYSAHTHMLLSLHTHTCCSASCPFPIKRQKHTFCLWGFWFRWQQEIINMNREQTCSLLLTVFWGNNVDIISPVVQIKMGRVWEGRGDVMLHQADGPPIGPEEAFKRCRLQRTAGSIRLLPQACRGSPDLHPTVHLMTVHPFVHLRGGSQVSARHRQSTQAGGVRCLRTRRCLLFFFSLLA